MIRVGIIGVGNCASSLVQGLEYYKDVKSDEPEGGLMHPDLGGYLPRDIEVVAAFDVDATKVGAPLDEAIYASMNNTMPLSYVPQSEVIVQRGPTYDGLDALPDIDVSEAPVVAVGEYLLEAGVDVLVNYLPVGSQLAAEFYMAAAVTARVAVVNCMPVFVASDPEWAARFIQAGIPIVGDDIKSQVGATIVHRVLTDLFEKRGVDLSRTYQLNFGGNADFLNMLDRERLVSKKISKTQSVQSQLEEELPADEIHVGPSDYVPWLNDRKWAYIHMLGFGFGGAPIEIELKLQVHDSPNSAGVVIDAVRCAAIGVERSEGGPLYVPSAYLMKSPPVQTTDSEAYEALEAWIK